MNKKLPLFGLLFLLYLSANAQIVLPMNSSWKYYKGTSAPSSDNESWKETIFDDSSWPTGYSPFRYGDGTGGTVLTDMLNNYTSVFLRKVINITTPDSLIDDAVFKYLYDDGFRIYINGSPLVERNAPTTDAYNAVSPTYREYTDVTDSTVLKSDVHGLKSGNNTVVVALYNSSTTSSDLYFDLSIEIKQKIVIPTIPKAPDVQFSTNGGYFSDPFDLTMSSVNSGDTIKYTFDYSEPQKSSTALTGISPFTININPNITGRPQTPGVVVRASVIKNGYELSSETRTYIFSEKIKTQSNPGGNWPAVNTSDYNQQFIDYDIDSRIVNDTRYSANFLSNFLSIPTVSIVTDNPNLFDATQGIYVNAMNRSELWERPASMEYINTDNTESFSVNLGLRIRGGYSRNDWNPKHGFRIFMSSEYGKKKLEFPLFGEDAAQEFKKFDLRCAQNYSWSFYNDHLYTNVQDETCRDIQGLMGDPYTRSSYCHVFLNGMYWGLYEFQERPEANFGASYLGGKSENFDVIKVAVDKGMVMEATDGTMAKYQLLCNLATSGFSNITNYYKLQGLNSEGKVDTTIEALADVDNLIDYMLNIFYSGNFDAPLTIWWNNNGPNNIYCIKNRNHKREGFIFIVHDAEHTLNYAVGSSHEQNLGVNINRVNLEDQGMNSSFSVSNFTPQQLHYKLMSNSEYKVRFADKVQKYFYNNGIFTPTRVEQVLRSRASQISDAIICESARWGDSNGGTLRTKDNDWLPAINNTVNLFIKLRTPIVLEQLENEGLLSTIDAPEIKIGTTSIITQSYNLSKAVDIVISNPQSEGTVYYTLDGSDPRLTGGNISPDALVAGENSITINYPLILKARILSGTEWGPVRELTFTNKNNRANLRITEIQYNPGIFGSQDSKDLEYIEIKNVGDEGIDMGGLKLDSAIHYKFPEGTIINPHSFVVIASERNGFETLYKIKPSGQFTGNLNNSGDRIVLVDESNNPLIDVTYGVTYPWPINVNGSGYSLVSNVNPSNDPDDAEYWHSSKLKYGSPFSDDSTFTGVDVKYTIEGPLSIYPIPSDDKVIIEGRDINKLELYDLNGKRLWEETVRNNYNSNFSLSFNSLSVAQGIYLLKVYSGNNIKVKKLIYRK